MGLGFAKLRVAGALIEETVFVMSPTRETLFLSIRAVDRPLLGWGGLRRGAAGQQNMDSGGAESR